MMVQPVVDERSLLAFHGTLVHLLGAEELDRILAEAGERSRRLQALLAPDRVAALTDDALYRLLRSISATRRRARELLERAGPARLREALARVVSSPDEPAQALAAFVERAGPVGRSGASLGLGRATAIELGSECLRHTRPGAAWSWPRWLWDPVTGRGALRLVTYEGYSLRGSDLADTYARIGVALGALRQEGERRGLWPREESPAAVETLLAGVYMVYLGTVVRAKTTKEFVSQVLPEVSVLVRRLLGTYRMEV